MYFSSKISHVNFNRHSILNDIRFMQYPEEIFNQSLHPRSEVDFYLSSIFDTGECWSLSNGSELEYHRQRPSDDCVRGTLIEKCTAEDRLCVGKIHGTYIYKIIA